MRVLALETSSPSGSVAVCEVGKFLTEFELDGFQRTAQSLSPAMHSILQHVSWKPRDVELVAVTQGPGSFTGLRAGITAAKVFAYACGCEVIGISTLEAIAAQTRFESAPIWAVIDAQRNQLFAAQFDKLGETTPNVLRPTHIVDNSDWLKQLRTNSIVSGPGVQKLIDRLPAGVEVSPQDTWQPQARTIAQLGCERYEAGERHDLWKLVPEYFRKSAAEEKLSDG